MSRDIHKNLTVFFILILITACSDSKQSNKELYNQCNDKLTIASDIGYFKDVKDSLENFDIHCDLSGVLNMTLNIDNIKKSKMVEDGRFYDITEAMQYRLIDDFPNGINAKLIDNNNKIYYDETIGF
ncbi:hypothetical protein [Mycoplasma sp. P36-A1]|uniref:hypothetical protein n=1 Tax=Mycoplasma sp. P36-A1 TaxID=3252900 RepID=UPI003C309203